MRWFVLLSFLASCAPSPGSSDAGVPADSAGNGDGGSVDLNGQTGGPNGTTGGEDSELRASVRAPVATGTRGAVHLYVDWGAITEDTFVPRDVTSSDETVLRIDEVIGPDVDQPDIWTTALSAGTSTLGVSVDFGQEFLEVELPIEVRDATTFEPVGECSGGRVYPDEEYLFQYRLGDAAGELFGDIRPVVSIEPAPPSVEYPRTYGDEPERLRFQPTLGLTTIRWDSLDIEHGVYFVTAAELDELDTAEIDLGERGPGEFGTANITFLVRSEGEEVCVQYPDTIDWNLVDGVDCEAFPQVRADTPLEWRIENYGPDGCTIAFDIKGGSATPIEIETP